jgi:hypothetical protein
MESAKRGRPNEEEKEALDALSALPAEILVQIFAESGLGVLSILRLSKTNWALRNFCYESNKMWETFYLEKVAYAGLSKEDHLARWQGATQLLPNRFLLYYVALLESGLHSQFHDGYDPFIEIGDDDTNYAAVRALATNTYNVDIYRNANPATFRAYLLRLQGNDYDERLVRGDTLSITLTAKEQLWYFLYNCVLQGGFKLNKVYYAPGYKLFERCISCQNVAAAYVCSGCQDAHYCGFDCQVQHWRNGHARSCK